MLTIRVGGTSVYDESEERFREQDGILLDLEHSLISISKWEQEFEKPFLSPTAKTSEEALAYIRCMVLTENPPGDFLEKLSKENMEEIDTYINKKMTATWFSEQPGAPKSNEIITADLVYYWLTLFSIPFECENWHLNRLFTLIRIANIKQSKPKKMSRAEIAERNRKLNAERKAALGTKG